MINNNNNYYDNISEEFKELSKNKINYLTTINYLAKNNIKDGLLLDIGSGNGQRLKKIIEDKDVVVNIVESSSRMVKEALKIFDKSLIYNCSFENFNIKKKYTTVLALWNVLGHVDDRVEFLRRVALFLEDNGVFIFDVNNRYNIKQYGLRYFLINILKDILNISNSGYFNIEFGGVKTSVYIYNEAELLRDLRLSGLKVIDIKYIDYNSGAIIKTKFMGQIFMVVAKI